MELKELCLKLAYSETEKEIINILKNEHLWETPENWEYFGNKENNYGEIGNQQSKADGALVEKIINSVDAVLMAENKIRRNKDPNYIEPRTIRDATEKFFNVEEGKLSNITARERTKLAGKINLIATGTKSKPNYTILDFGEGQTPLNFKNTLLSLGKSNKLRTPFVQGKFNMGGTGVFRFCGEKNISLIISKRHPELAKYENDDNSKDSWGFTVIIREYPTETVRSSTYKYLIIDGDVPYFESKTLPLGPLAFPNKYGKEIVHGTFIKLFEYDLGQYKTLITLNLNYRLSLLMPQIAIPIRLYEYRKYKANTLETTMSGLEVRLDEDKTSNLEEKYISSGSITVEGNTLNYSIYPFKSGKIANYSPKEGVIFLLNGQTQGIFSNSFFKRKKVGLGYIADSLLVMVDCSNFSPASIEKYFKNDRETIITSKFKEIESALEEEIKNNPGLRLLNSERKKQEIENKLQDSKPFAEILSNILKNSPTLSKILLKGLRITNPFNTKEATNAQSYIGKFYPTYFKLIKDYSINNPKEVAIGNKARLRYKTDAPNNYFERSKDPGSFELYINDKLSQNSSIRCWNGNGNLSIKLNDFKQGDIIKLKSIVKDVSSEINPFEDEFYIKIIKESKNRGKVSNRKNPSKSGNGKNNEIDSLALPDILTVKKDDWEKHSFTEKSALKVVANENSYDFFLNMDNLYLLNELKHTKKDEINLVEARYKFGLVIIALSILNEDSKNENIDVEVSKISEKLAPIIIPMISSLGDLKIEDFNEE